MSDEIEELLRSADRPRELHEDELSRLRTRVEAPDAAPIDVVRLEAMDARDTTETGAAFERRARVPKVLGVLVAAAAMAVVFGVSTGADDDEVRTGNPPAPQLSAVEQVCVGPISELDAGVESWQGVANWSLTTRGEPDLSRLVDAALTALADAAATNPAAEVALAELDRATVDAESLLPVSAEAIEARELAVTNAIRAIDGIVSAAEPDSPECRFPTLAEIGR